MLELAERLNSFDGELCDKVDWNLLPNIVAKLGKGARGDALYLLPSHCDDKMHRDLLPHGLGHVPDEFVVNLLQLLP